MRIKTKLTLGVGLLFLLILLLAVVSTLFINALSNDTQNILVANYNTLDYSRDMLLALDEPRENRSEAFARFAENLEKQQANLTEVGEKEITDALATHFTALRSNPADTAQYQAIRADLYEIMNLNMHAIVRKNEVAKQTAETATFWIAIVGTLCFLIAFTLLINLPGSIASPIRELTERIRQIAAKNYQQRVNFEQHNEFGDLARAFNTMAEKLEEYAGSNLAELLTEKKRIETLIAQMNDPVIGLDADKKILFVNAEALKVLGMRAKDVIGMPAPEVAINNDLMRALMRGLTPSAGMPDTGAEKGPLKIFANGKESYFDKEILEITDTPTGEQSLRRLGHVILLRNITPFKELDAAKTNFIATISHELKTPISSIKMSLQLLDSQRTGVLNAEQKQLAESIHDDADRLLKITGELLDLAQSETGNIQLNLLPSEPQSMLRFALDTVRTQAEQKQIHLEIHADDPLPLVKADPEKTAWVLVNFLTNAIRYSPEHSTVVIELRREDQQVLFAVRDTGKGIDTRYRDRIFDRYFQVPGSPKTGTGLGLAISKEFIEAQGGSIGMESEFGMGSRFYFRLGV